MKIRVFGAGAIGGLIAGRLARLEHDVSVVARGAHLAAVQANGLIVKGHRGGGPAQDESPEETHRVVATSDARTLGPQDYVIVAVKTWALAAAARDIATLVGPHTTIVPAMNGVPWWFFDGFGPARSDTRSDTRLDALDALDKDGLIAASLPIGQVLGCVVYPAAHIAEPGVVVHTGRRELVLGEPDGRLSDRARLLQGLLNDAGFACNVTGDIRLEIWRKLIGNASFNPVSALTCATLDKMLAEPAAYALLKTLMAETIAVGNGLGLAIDETPDARLARGRSMGAVKFSMLQDLEAGRPFEYEALTGAVVAIARRLGIDAPALGHVHALIKLRALAMNDAAAGR